jgi:hypothetical protein
MAKDFFDQDLVEARAVRSAPPPTVPETGSSDDMPARTISDLNLTRMAKYREQRQALQAETAKELEASRRRMEELERSRRVMEEETKQLDRFEQSRKEVSERLDQTLVMLEKHEMQAIRLTELYAGTKMRFKELQEEIRAIKDTEWNDDQIREEVNRALVVIDDARKEYGKAMARLEAAEGGASAGSAALGGEAGPVALASEPRDFLYWVKTGFAFFLPLMGFLLVLGLIAAVAMGLRS